MDMSMQSFVSLSMLRKDAADDKSCYADLADAKATHRSCCRFSTSDTLATRWEGPCFST